MKNQLKTLLFVPLIAALAALTGCSKSPAKAGLDPAKVPAAVATAFAKAPEGTREQANECLTAYQSQDPATAFIQLRKLGAKPDLTSEQRAVVSKAMQAAFNQMQAAAQNGNAAARTTMHQYLTTR